jgi:hypothetical protein
MQSSHAEAEPRVQTRTRTQDSRQNEFHNKATKATKPKPLTEFRRVTIRPRESPVHPRRIDLCGLCGLVVNISVFMF